MSQSDFLDQSINNAALIIIGMHRSGTSATTGAFSCLGVQLGRRLYKGQKNINDKGYFEHSDIADTNEGALLALGFSWDDVLLKPEGWWKNPALQPFTRRIAACIRRDFSPQRLWAVKDPRVCRLLPWWLPILDSEGYTPHLLFVLRAPENVYGSLHKRDGFSRDKAYWLWILHYLEAERWSRSFPRAFMDYDTFLDAPQAQLTRASQQLNLAFPVSPEAASGCLDHFLSKALRHHSGQNVPTDPSPIQLLALDVLAELHRATQAPTALDTVALDALWLRMKQIQDDFTPMLVEHMGQTGRLRGKAENTLERVLRSWSWYVGKPIRVLERMFGREV